ncbi:beta-lactamase class A [Arthrobacter ginsengisoli]|uniref:Beta-lactamase class A n=1 Tax=Arthrobacter ginsengisoli TaxID=1356565 RepID=A0ABU1U717_9MICC|nr:serine hydrolase [Arthrobacter ginsengisoli]MDR7080992.1 beta-lactamase class A [Arthrobacter ginsengisoli]
MDSWGSGRHYSSGRHTREPARGAGRGLPGLLGGIRPQFLIVLVAVLGLVSAATVYATIQARPPLDADAPPATSASATAVAANPLSATGTAPPAAVTAPPSAAAVPAPVVASPDPTIGPALDAEINAVIEANSAYRVGVALIDVRDGAVHEYGVKTKFVAASTGKILAAAAYYHLVETGKASLAARMGASTAGQQIRQMVQQSNNDSWALILAAVGHKGLINYAATMGIPYDRTVNALTPAEMGKILSELYSGRLLNAQNTAQLLSYMQQTNYETLIPAATPPGISVFHKYGLLNGNLHDASVLVRGERAYVFVVYTQGRDLSDMADRTRVIHELTATVTAGLF